MMGGKKLLLLNFFKILTYKSTSKYLLRFKVLCIIGVGTKGSLLYLFFIFGVSGCFCQKFIMDISQYIKVYFSFLILEYRNEGYKDRNSLCGHQQAQY